MQLRMSPTGGIPSSSRRTPDEPPSSATVDDRGQVARVLLEAAQERRQAGPAADRDDPRAAGEEPLLVDELDERLVRRRRERNGSVSAADRPGTDRDDEDASPIAPTIEPAQRERQELERQRCR